MRSSRVALAAGIAIVVIAVVQFAVAHWNTLYDDAFIYLRYVRNLDNGCGLRFNCRGIAVEGFTGPLYLAVLYAGSLVTTKLIVLCQIVGIVSLIAAGALAILVALRLADREHPQLPAVVAIATAVVLALDPFVKLNANIGMETAMAAAVLTLVAYAAIAQKPWLLVGAAIAGFLVRPEAALFVVALPLLPWMRNRRYLAVAAGALVAITLARYAIFGQLAPNTYYAKSGGTWRHAAIGAEYILDCLVDFPLAFLAPLALLSATHRRAVTYLLAVSAAWLVFFLRSGGDLFDYSRLWFPLVPMLSALALAGVAELPKLEKLAKLARIRLALPAVLAVLVGTRAAIAHAIPPQGTSPRVLQWMAIGNYLRAHYPRGSLVAVVPIGAIGYYSALPILDLVGLTEPEISRAGRGVPEHLLTKLWIGHERNNTEYVLSREPAVIVTTMVRDTPWTLADARAGFWADWLLLQEIKAGRAPYVVRDAEVAPGQHILMFERAQPTPKTTTPPFGGGVVPPGGVEN